MTSGPFCLAGEVVVVTGGMGQLGAHFVEALVAAGAEVAVVDPADGAVPAGVLHLEADVTDRGSLEAALAAVTEAFGAPSGLVNNAALDAPPHAPAEESGPFEHYPESSWDAVMDVNVKGVFLCCQVFGGAMASAGRGAIVNVSSLYGIVSPDQRLYEHRRRRGETFYKPVSYSVSKSALLNLTRYLATYWGPSGVRVNTLVPGGVFNDQDPEFLAAYSARTPLGRMAQPDEYDGAVVFLLAPASRYMTGAMLVIDGGFTAW